MHLPSPETSTDSGHSLALTEVQQSLILLREIVEQMSRAEADSLMSKQEVADYLNVSLRTVDTLIAEQELIPVRIRSMSRFTRDTVERYVRRNSKSR